MNHVYYAAQSDARQAAAIGVPLDHEIYVTRFAVEDGIEVFEDEIYVTRFDVEDGIEVFEDVEVSGLIGTGDRSIGDDDVLIDAGFNRIGPWIDGPEWTARVEKVRP